MAADKGPETVAKRGLMQPWIRRPKTQLCRTNSHIKAPNSAESSTVAARRPSLFTCVLLLHPNAHQSSVNDECLISLGADLTLSGLYMSVITPLLPSPHLRSYPPFPPPHTHTHSDALCLIKVKVETYFSPPVLESAPHASDRHEDGYTPTTTSPFFSNVFPQGLNGSVARLR